MGLVGAAFFGWGGGGGAGAEGVAVLGLDAVKDGAAAEPGEADFEAEGKGEGGGEGTAAFEEAAGAFDLELEAGAEVGGSGVGGEVGFGDVVAWPVFLGDVDAVFFEVHANVLPEVGELEGGADGVGLGEAFVVVKAVEEEDEAADGVGGAAAIVEDAGVGGVAFDGDVLGEGGEEVLKEGDGEVVAAAGVGEGGEDPVPFGRDGPAFGGGEEGGVEVAQEAEAFGGREIGGAGDVVAFIGEVVGGAGEGVDGGDGGLEAARDKPGHGEILVVGPGEGQTAGVGLVELHGA
jgi:hypothetical protein